MPKLNENIKNIKNNYSTEVNKLNYNQNIFKTNLNFNNNSIYNDINKISIFENKYLNTQVKSNQSSIIDQKENKKYIPQKYFKYEKNKEIKLEDNENKNRDLNPELLTFSNKYLNNQNENTNLFKLENKFKNMSLEIEKNEIKNNENNINIQKENK